MNKITSWFSSRLALTLVTVMSMAYAAAQNVLTIDPVTITSNGGVTVPVNLNSTTDIRTLIFDITLPDGVSVVGAPVMATDRVELEAGETPNDIFTLDVNNNPDNKGANVWRVGIFGLYSYSQILAGEGELLSLNLAITEDAFFAGGSFTETITPVATKGVEGGEFVVTIVPPAEPIAAVTAPEMVEVVSGEKAPVAISLENNLAVSSLKFDIVLPEALTLAKNGRRYDFTYGPRWASNNSVSVTENETGVRVIISNVSTNVIAQAGEGELLTFYVIADDVHSKANIKITGINATMKWAGVQKDIYSPDQTIIAVNEALMQTMIDQIEEDEALINELATSFQQFNTLVDEEFPGYANLKADEIAAVNAMIEALNEKFIEAQSQADQTGIYEGIPQEDLMAATDALMALVTGEEEAIAAITAAYEEDVDAINEIANALQEFNETIENEFPAFATLEAEQIAAATAMVEALNDKVTAGMEAAFETGEYTGPTHAEIVAATEAVMQLSADADAAYAAIMDAAMEDYDNLSDLNDSMAGILDDETEFPAFIFAYGDEVGAAAEALRALLNQFELDMYTAFFETGVYEGLSQEEITNATDLVMGLVTTRAEALAAIENAAEADYEKLAELAAQLEPIVSDEDDSYSEGVVAQAEVVYAEIIEQLDAVRAAQAEALEETGEYVSPLDEDTLAAIAAEIEEVIKTSSIESVLNSADGALYFDLNGLKVNEPKAGNVYIKVVNGHAAKYVHK